MFCPQCGQERTSDATSFCSRCGFLLTFTSRLLETRGTPPAAWTPRSAVRDAQLDDPRSNEAVTMDIGGAPFLIPQSPVRRPQLNDPRSSPRARGIKQGVFMFLLTFLVAPVLGMISVFAFGIRPWPMGIAIFLLGVGGLLRMAYALMFESKAPDQTQNDAGSFLGPQSAGHQLVDPANSQFSTINSQFPATGSWRDTRELEPHSVTENTTRHLEKKVKGESEN